MGSELLPVSLDDSVSESCIQNASTWWLFLRRPTPVLGNRFVVNTLQDTYTRPLLVMANDVGQTEPTKSAWVFGSWLKTSPGSVTLPGPMGSTSTNKEMRDWLQTTRDSLPESSQITRVITALSLEPARRRYWIH